MEVVWPAGRASIGSNILVSTKFQLKLSIKLWARLQFSSHIQLTSGTTNIQIWNLPGFKTKRKLKMAPTMRPVSRPQNRYVQTSRCHNDSAHLYVQSKVETAVVVMETAVVVMATYNLTVQDRDGVSDVFPCLRRGKFGFFPI